MDRERSPNDCLEWLQTRLAGDIAWAAPTVSPFLSVATLRQIAACFRLLEAGTKVKVLLSFLSMRPDDLEAGRATIRKIAEAALQDSDDWVCIIARLIADFAADGTVRPDLSGVSKGFASSLAEIHDCGMARSGPACLPPVSTSMVRPQTHVLPRTAAR